MLVVADPTLRDLVERAARHDLVAATNAERRKETYVFSCAFLLKKKSEVEEAIMSWLLVAERQCGRELKIMPISWWWGVREIHSNG